MTLTEQQLQELWLLNHNAITSRLYLWSANQDKLNALRKTSKSRATFKQVQKEWRRLKQGSKSVTVTHVELDEETGRKTVAFHRVFNMDDIETQATTTERSISDKQKHLLTKLLQKKYFNEPALLDWYIKKLDSLTASQASEAITKLMEERQAVNS